jgi:hypothetical protein
MKEGRKEGRKERNKESDGRVSHEKCEDMYI